MKAKKTIEIKVVKETINSMILHSPDKDAEGRDALIVLAKSILMETNNYNGFNYLSPEKMSISASGTTCGIDQNRLIKQWFNDTDQTRVFFY